MSAFNVGKKVSAAVRILQRKRDASARATHLKAENWIVQYSTNERKQMSTKTSIKRIALVAAAALTLGGFSAVSANAIVTVDTTNSAGWAFTSAYSSSGTSGSQVVGGLATLTFTETATVAGASKQIVTTFQADGVGSIGSASASAGVGAGIAPAGATSGTVTYPTTSISLFETASAAESLVTTIVVSSATAGTQHVVASVYDANGTPSKTYTATITWIATAAAGISKANSLAYVVTAAGTCTFGTSHASDVAAAGNNTAAITSITANTAVKLCVSSRDAADNAVAMASSNTISSAGVTATGNTATATETLTVGAPPVGVTGATTITSIIVDAYGNAISLTTALSYYGSTAKLALANYTYAAQYGGDTSTPGTATAGKGQLLLTATDSNGAQVDGALQAIPSLTFTIDSDAVAAAAADRTNDSFGVSAAISGAAAGSDLFNYGANVITVDCTSATQAQKLKITAWGKNSLGVWVSSGSVDFYCSTAATGGKVTVTPADTAIESGASTTVNVSVVDKYGYPVPDGTAVTLSANNGAGLNTPSTTTLNGVFKYAATLLAGSASPATVLAVGPKATAGSAQITVSGGSADAGSLSLDAANAATDAANNAYDEAQNATQAASDALAAVTALSAQVGALIATVKSLAAVVAKIKAKVKA